MKQIKTVLVDDQRESSIRLEQELKPLQRIDVVKVFTDPRKVLSYLDEHPKIQLVIVDKEMKNLDGFDLVAQLPQHIVCVMVTGYHEYAVDAYDNNIIDYIVKPVERARLINMLRKVEEKLQLTYSVAADERDATYFTVKTAGGSFTIIVYDEVAYIRSQKDECWVYLIGSAKPLVVNQRIGEIYEELPKNSFLRVHNVHIVNKNYARMYADEQLQVRVGAIDTKLSVGGKYKKEVFQWLNDRLVGKR